MCKSYKRIYLLTACFVAVLFWFQTKSILGQYYTENNQNESLIVDKKVRSLSMDSYLDNISAATFTFQQDSNVEFQITVKNNGTNDLSAINVRDILPHHLALIFYPGTINGDEIDWTIDKLSPNESKVFIIRAKINIDSHPTGKQVNKVTASSTNLSDTDTATYFIGQPIVPVTGDDSLPLKSVIMVTFIGSGLVLRKIARGY